MLLEVKPFGLKFNAEVWNLRAIYFISPSGCDIPLDIIVGLSTTSLSSVPDIPLCTRVSLWKFFKMSSFFQPLSIICVIIEKFTSQRIKSKFLFQFMVSPRLDSYELYCAVPCCVVVWKCWVLVRALRLLVYHWAVAAPLRHLPKLICTLDFLTQISILCESFVLPLCFLY